MQNFIDRLSGEHSQVAPEHRTPYEKGTPDENIEVVMARLERPGAATTNKKTISKIQNDSNQTDNEQSTTDEPKEQK